MIFQPHIRTLRQETEYVSPQPILVTWLTPAVFGFVKLTDNLGQTKHVIPVQTATGTERIG